MIITILPSSTTFHAIAYNEKKVEKGQASLIEAANIGLRQEAYTADNLREYFELYSARNTRIQNTQFHVAVSCKGNEYSYEQLLDIAHCYLKEMGYAEEGQPLLVYTHRDTPNNHIHIITSRVAPDGHRISDKFEKKHSREVCERIMQEYHSQQAGQNIDGQQSTSETANTEVWNEALSYRYTSKAQFYAILESMGYDCKEDEQDYSVSFYKNNTCQGKLSLQEILRHAIKENRPDNRRRQQLRAILQKYRNLSANKEELAAHMKRKFGISLVWLGKADTPYGYIVVDHKNKTVFKGGEFLSIKELLQFERFVLGIGGVLTFKKSHLPEVLPETVPLDRIVLETDAPYMAPVPMRGQRNEPAFVAHVLRRLAEAYGVAEEEVAAKTNANCQKILNINV